MIYKSPEINVCYYYSMLLRYLLIPLLLIFIRSQGDDTIEEDQQKEEKEDKPSNILTLETNITLDLKSNQSKSYEIHQLDFKQGKIWNLFFVAEPIKGLEWTNLDILVSRKNANGNLTKIISCEDIGVDSCLIPASTIRLDDILVVEFKCMQETLGCNYTFKSYWSENFPINVGRRLRIDFESEAYAQVFSLDLSKEIYKEVRIILRAETFLVGTAPIKMVANYGSLKAPEFNNFEIGSTHLWDDGQGIFLSKINMTSQKLLILIQGPAQNVLLLDVVLINQHNNELILETPLYDYLRNEAKRSYFFNITQKSIKDDDIVVKISTFSGRLNITFYKDENATNQILGGQFSHHGQLQYIFPRDYLISQKVKQKLYVVISSPLYDSTFVINVFGRNDTMIKLSNDIEDMAEIKAGEIVNFYVDAFTKTNHTQDKQLKFSVHNIIGKVRAYFSICTLDDVELCSVNFRAFNTSPSKYDTLIPTEIQETGSSTHYRLKIPLDKFDKKTENNNYKKITILILFASEDNQTKRFTIRYIDERIKILRDNHPLKDRLLQGEKRVYRSVDIQNDVEYVAIHLIEISGFTRMIGTNKNPMAENVPISEAFIPTKNEIIYYPDASNHTRKDPLFITVYGQENSLYSIVLTFFRKHSVNPSPNENDTFNYITIPENVEQQLTISPQTVLVVKLQPNNRDYNFLYSSSYPLEFCARNSPNKLPIDPYCDFKILSTEYKLPSVTSLFVGIKNNNSKIATVRVKYVSNQSQKCQIQKLGKVWRKNIEKDVCVTYKVSKKDTIEFMISLNKLQSKSGKYYAQINQKNINYNSHHFVVTKQLMEQECSKTIECQLSLYFVNLMGAQVQVVAQSSGKQLILLDGLAQDVYAVSSPNVPKYFKYYLVNKLNTTFFVESKKGYFQFYVNIGDASDEELNKNSLYPNKSSFKFQSQSSRYTIYSQLTISAQNISRANCNKCVAYITVVGSKEQYRDQGHFVVEVSQQVRTLKQHESAIGFLAKQSFAYYEYYFPNEKGTLIISLTTQKTRCGTIYLSKGTLQKASGSNYLNKTHSGELIVDVEKGAYSITVEATQLDCQYVISATASDFKIYQLKPGVYQDIKFEEKGQINYFLYNHLSNTSFKVMSIQQYGEVMISAKEVSQAQLENLSKNDTQKSTFTFKETKDILFINPKNVSGYVPKQNTYYFIAVEATKPTVTSILLYNGQVQIPLSNQNIITDNGNKNETMTYKIYAGDAKQLNISLNIHYGMVEVKVVELNQSKIFKAQSVTQLWQVKLQREVIYRPVVVKVEILNDTMYSLKLRYNSSSQSDTMMKHGLPTYIFLDNKEFRCVYGDLAENDQKLIVSVYKTQKDKLSQLKYTTKVNNKTASTSAQIVQNTMIISLKDQFKQEQFKNSSLIEYCFQNPQGYLSVTLIPSSTVTFLPEATMMPVRVQQNFTLYPNGKFWIQILECEGTTSLLLSRQFSKMGKTESQILHWRTFGDNYLLEVVDHYGLAYMNVQGKHSLVRWSHIDQASGEGTGYYAIRLPHFSYQIKNSSLSFKIPPVIKLNRMNVDFLTFRPNYGFFNLMISSSLNELKKSVQCSQGKSYILNQQFTNMDWKKSFDFTVLISKLKQIYPNQNYVYASGALELYVKMSDKNTQSYRFMMSSERIPISGAEYDTENQDEQIFDIDEITKSGSYLWILIGLVVIVVLACACRFFYNRYKLRRALLNNENSGALEMRYSEYSVG